MTAPLPSPSLSPMAGLCNALMRLYIRRALPLIAAQQLALDEARNVHHKLTAARDFRATKAAGYIDRTGLDA
ncbi:hypothetical protein [Streptomyces sp. NPDC001652]|uniref:hypothetical protein n=1 Tax=Streptomyces sp. NPDC001652 TaxID=3154393 RepID=UPI0033246AED